MSCIRPWTSRSLNGAIRNATSRSISVSTPPSPNATSGPNVGIVGNAHERFHAGQHGLHLDECVAARLGRVGKAGDDIAKGRAHVLFVTQVKTDPSDISLVQDPGRFQLEHHRESDDGRRRCSFLFGSGGAAAQQRQPEGTRELVSAPPAVNQVSPRAATAPWHTALASRIRMSSNVRKSGGGSSRHRA